MPNPRQRDGHAERRARDRGRKRRIGTAWTGTGSSTQHHRQKSFDLDGLVQNYFSMHDDW